MNSHPRRIKAIEVSLTPHQIVLLWMEKAVKGTFAHGALQNPSPRSEIANSVARVVGIGLKGQPPDMVERAILRGRQEADSLYNIIVEVNSAVLTHFLARNREYLFLLGYLEAILQNPVHVRSVEQVRNLTLLFVEDVVLLDAAISQISAVYFGGRTILFTDCAEKLRDQLQMASQALEHFNILAGGFGFPNMTTDDARERLSAEVDQQVLRWTNIARIEMLAAFGTAGEFRADFSQVVRQHENSQAATL